jgi:hypothetical protein
MTVRRSLLMLCVVGIVSSVVRADDVVTLERQDKTVAVRIGGQEFATYNFDSTLPKPYFSPVKAADGTIVTRGLEKPEDHPHHKGIWCSIDEVNDIKYWAEKGKIVNAGVGLQRSQGNPACLHVVNHWLGTDGLPLMNESTTISIFANRLLVYDVSFSPARGDTPVTFHDTKEGMFGIRLANSMRGKEGGKIVNAEGLQGEKACWGQESKWVDYFGQINGKTYGVAIFDHPANARKSRYHVRDYGLFTLSPFGQKSYTNGKLPDDPLTLKPGENFRLRYGLYVHDGDTAAGKVSDVANQFVKATGG